MGSVIEQLLQSMGWYLLFGGVVLCALWEAFFPRRTEAAGMEQRWITNGFLTAINFAVAYGFNSLVLIWGAATGQAEGWGLLSSIELGVVGSLVLTLMVFESIDYWLHRIFHRIPWLWRLHCIHHSDTEVDFTTAYRHHPFESMLALLVSLFFILLLGLPAYAVLSYQLFRALVAIWSHSNVYIPTWIECWLKYLIVTPDFHRLHHASERRFTDSNYATTMPCLDIIFGTGSHKSFAEHIHLELGLEYLRGGEDNRLGRLLLIPFVKSRQKIKPDTNLSVDEIKASSSGTGRGV